VVLSAADGMEVSLASVAGKEAAADEDANDDDAAAAADEDANDDDDAAAAAAASVEGNSAELFVVNALLPCDGSSAGGRSFFDMGGIIMSNILSETLAQERRRFFFSSPRTDPEVGADCGD
jgi:hypothetical protein